MTAEGVAKESAEVWFWIVYALLVAVGVVGIVKRYEPGYLAESFGEFVGMAGRLLLIFLAIRWFVRRRAATE